MSALAEDAISFCKIDANLDTNPKIRKAGRDGRDVFEFVVRRNSLMGRDGSIPLKYIDPTYLSELLMMNEEEASHGVSRAVTAKLLECDMSAGVVRIVGWTPEWGRTRKSDAQRKADQRERDRSKQPETQSGVTGDRDSCDTSRDVTLVTDQRRGEERRSEREIPPAADKPSPGLEVLKAKVDKAVGRAHALPDDWAPSRCEANLQAEAAARNRGIDLEIELAKMRDWSKGQGSKGKRTDWDATWRNWTRNANAPRGAVPFSQQRTIPEL